MFDVLGENQNVAFDDLGKMHQLGLVSDEFTMNTIVRPSPLVPSVTRLRLALQLV